jgi:predicted ATPase with chaperone activity
MSRGAVEAMGGARGSVTREAWEGVGLRRYAWPRRLATILPARRLAAAREPTRIQSVAGLTSGRTAVVTTRPFRAPHHTIADVGLIGGGQRPMPGEGSLAHHGRLFFHSANQSFRSPKAVTS